MHPAGATHPAGYSDPALPACSSRGGSGRPPVPPPPRLQALEADRVALPDGPLDGAHKPAQGAGRAHSPHVYADKSRVCGRGCTNCSAQQCMSIAAEASTVNLMRSEACHFSPPSAAVHPPQPTHIIKTDCAAACLRVLPPCGARPHSERSSRGSRRRKRHTPCRSCAGGVTRGMAGGVGWGEQGPRCSRLLLRGAMAATYDAPRAPPIPQPQSARPGLSRSAARDEDAPQSRQPHLQRVLQRRASDGPAAVGLEGVAGLGSLGPGVLDGVGCGRRGRTPGGNGCGRPQVRCARTHRA